jgi:DegV family protein with EDD domain
MLRNAKKAPTSSASAPQPYLEAFQNASLKAENIICLTEPSHFSAMYDSAHTALQTAKSLLGNVKIEVIECTTAAAGQGLVALAAARAAAVDKSFAEVKNITATVMNKVSLYATLNTLEYLARSGRVPQAAHMVNTILSIKPVFTLNHQGARTVALARTMKNAISRIVKFMETTVKKDQHLHVAVMHADDTADAALLKENIATRFEYQELYITEFTPVMGVHTGPGLIGVAFYAE